MAIATEVTRRVRRFGDFGARRRPLVAMVTPEALRGFESFAASRGVTVTGCIEALGLTLAEAAYHPDSPLDALVERARAFDAERTR